MLENEVMNEEVEATEMDNEVEDSKVEEPQNEQESVHLISKGEAAGVALWEGGKKAVHWIGSKIDPDGTMAKARAERKQARKEAKEAKKKAKAEAKAQQVENKSESTEEK